MIFKTVPVPKKIGPGKKYRYQYRKKYRSLYRKKLVPEKSTGTGTGKKLVPKKSTGTGKNWSQKKVPVPVPEKILGTVTLCHTAWGQAGPKPARVRGWGVRLAEQVKKSQKSKMFIESNAEENKTKVFYKYKYILYFTPFYILHHI